MSKSDATLEIRRIAYNVEEGAAALGIDKDRMGGLVRIGRVPHVMLGGRVLIGVAALDQWLTAECLSNLREQADAPRRIGRKAS